MSRFGWSDSSPIKGRNWFLSKHVRIATASIASALHAAHELSLDKPWLEDDIRHKRNHQSNFALQADGCVDDVDSESGDGNLAATSLPDPRASERLSTSRRRCLCAFLRDIVQHHVHVPQRLGTHAENLAYKRSAFAQSCAVECRTQKDLSRYLEGVASWCTDMGTEMGQADFQLPATRFKNANGSHGYPEP